MHDVYGEPGDTANDPDKVRAAIDERNIPDWQKQLLWEAHAVKSGSGTRYIRIEPDDSHEGYEDMQDLSRP